MEQKFRVVTRGKGLSKKYYIQLSKDGGNTWNDMGFTYKDEKEAADKLNFLNKNAGGTVGGPKGTSTNGGLEGLDLEKVFKSDEEDTMTKGEAEKAGIPWRTLPTDYDLKHPDLFKVPSTDYIGWIDDDGMVHVPKNRKQTKVEQYVGSDGKIVTGVPPKEPPKMPKRVPEGEVVGSAIIPPEEKPAETTETTETPEVTETTGIPETPETSEVAETTETTEETVVSTGNEKEDKKGAGSKYWKNILYGNDIGSVRKSKEAKEQKDLKMDNFLENNPNMVKAIFGRNSGLNFGERVARLGEMMAMIGADATKGAYAGFNRMSLPSSTKGKYNEIYNNALNKHYERKQDILESGNKAKIDKANRVSILKSSPILAVLPDYILNQFADKMVVGISKAERDNFNNWLNKRYSNEYIDEIWNTYDALRNTFSDVTTQRGNLIELNGKEFDLMRKPQAAIAELNSQKAQLQKMLVEVDSMPFEKLAEFMTNFKSIYSGIQSVSDSMSENKDFGYNASVEVKGGIPVFGGAGRGGVEGSNGSERSTDTKLDQMALEGLTAGKTTAEEWNSATKASRNALKASVQAAIDEINNQIKVLKKYHAIDDGIVKAPHMKQWLVREDGTRIALNPNDNVYATKNKLTTSKDNSKQDIVPMEKEDRVMVIQKKLGYNGDRNIIKQCDYYISKLK